MSDDEEVGAKVQRAAGQAAKSGDGASRRGREATNLRGCSCIDPTLFLSLISTKRIPVKPDRHWVRSGKTLVIQQGAEGVPNDCTLLHQPEAVSMTSNGASVNALSGCATYRNPTLTLSLCS